MDRFFPLASQLRAYTSVDFKGDVTAGITVGIMLIPQGMAYALIAGLPPIYGLYAALVPLVVYAFFGTSRQLAVGPVAMVSLLVAAGVAPLAGGDLQTYIGLTLVLSLMVGLLQFGLGLIRFGFLTDLLSHPVLAGFTSAAALIIGFSQLKHLLGISIERSNYIHDILWSALQQWQAIDPVTLILGVSGIVLMLGTRRLKKGIPGALVVVVIATVASWGLNLEEMGVRIVGSVPSGLPDVAVPTFTQADVIALLPAALTIGLVSFMESFAVAKVYASKHGYNVDPNRELVGLGLANVAGAFVQAYPTTGGFSRTAVNDQAGARTNAAALISAGIIALTLLYLTPLFYHLPQAALAAIIMVAVSGLFDWREATHLWHTDRRDFLLFALTFVATLSLGIEEGIFAGVIVSLGVVVYQVARPPISVLGRVPGTTSYRSTATVADTESPEGALVIRMDASLFFANAPYFQDRLMKAVQKAPDTLRTVVLDASPINRLDSTAAQTLIRIAHDLRRNNQRLVLAGTRASLREQLMTSGVLDALDDNALQPTVHAAVSAAPVLASSGSPLTM